MPINFFILGALISLAGCSTTFSDHPSLEATARRAGDMQLKVIGESILLNEYRVVIPTTSFDQGLVESRDEKSTAEITYSNGDKITLRNGKAHFGYMLADSISGLFGDKVLQEVNLNQRKITMYSGSLLLEIKEQPELNKTSYSIILGRTTIFTKSGSIKLSVEQTGKLYVLHGTAEIIFSAANSEALIRRSVLKGQEVEIPNPNDAPL